MTGILTQPCQQRLVSSVIEALFCFELTDQPVPGQLSNLILSQTRLVSRAFIQCCKTSHEMHRKS